MKKTLMFIMVAMLAVTFVFAVDGDGTAGKPATGEGESKSVTATLTLGNENFAGYSFGFSTSNPTIGPNTDNNVSGVTNTDSVTITYTSNGEAASSTNLYYYYKIRSKGKVDLKMTADRLKKDGISNDDTLKYTITGTGVNISGEKKVESDGTVLLNVSVTDGFISDSGQLTFGVTGLTPANLGTYSAKITYNIISAS